jgi:hypothetical protein
LSNATRRGGDDVDDIAPNHLACDDNPLADLLKISLAGRTFEELDDILLGRLQQPNLRLELGPLIPKLSSGCCSFARVRDVLEWDAWLHRLAEWHESSGTVRPTDIGLQIRMARRDELLLRRQLAHALLAIAPGRSAEGPDMALPFVA